ncbi:MAG: PepSY domain-containing protein [Erysipelotrichaceae bacterium]|nr:PepSY domain-containing protein [Erysipelotrichaceae bacterium]MDY5251583.1 PepSY domain-containing protein [Erysipelotrichaceae bacterium]
MKKIWIMIMATLVLVGCSKRITLDEAVALARQNAKLDENNSEVVKSSFEDDKYYVELMDDDNVYRYVIDDDGEIESFVKELNTGEGQAITLPANEATDAMVIADREEALKKVLEYFELTEDQVYEIEIDEDYLHTDRMVYKIDFKTADTEYEASVKVDGTIFNDKKERNDDKVIAFETKTTRQEAIDAALKANGHNYQDVDELTIKENVSFDQSYYEVEYEINQMDYDMIVNSKTLEVRKDN